MNKKVKIANIVLVLVFLSFLYISKIVFKQEYCMVITLPAFNTIGSFIDAHIIVYYIFNVIIGVLFDYLYFSSVFTTMKHKWYIWVIISAYNCLLAVIYTFVSIEVLINIQQYLVMVSSIYMICVPLLFNANKKALAITYLVNIFAQFLSLQIRDFSLLLSNTNSITQLFMSAENYLWLVFCLILFYKKGGNKNGNV